MNAIEVKNIKKTYKLYDKEIDILKEFFSKKKRYKDFEALKGVSFSVPKGLTYGILGGNGSGKSTILNIINGTTYPTSGTFSVKGKISLLNVSAGIVGGYTGLQNIYYKCQLMGLSKKEVDKKLDSIIEFSELGNFINYKVNKYSAGMKAKLGFAIAIHIEPDILIIDEALAVGDSRFSAKCHKKMDELKEKGITIIYVSHSHHAVKNFCTKACWINQGEFIGEGSSENISQIYEEFMANKINLSEAKTKVKDLMDKEKKESKEEDKLDVKNKVDSVDTITKEVKEKKQSPKKEEKEQKNKEESKEEVTKENKKIEVKKEESKAKFKAKEKSKNKEKKVEIKSVQKDNKVEIQSKGEGVSPKRKKQDSKKEKNTKSGTKKKQKLNYKKVEVKENLKVSKDKKENEKNLKPQKKEISKKIEKKEENKKYNFDKVSKKIGIMNIFRKKKKVNDEISKKANQIEVIEVGIELNKDVLKKDKEKLKKKEELDKKEKLLKELKEVDKLYENKVDNEKN